jgi:hypothetical protein
LDCGVGIGIIFSSFAGFWLMPAQIFRACEGVPNTPTASAHRFLLKPRVPATTLWHASKHVVAELN